MEKWIIEDLRKWRQHIDKLKTHREYQGAEMEKKMYRTLESMAAEEENEYE